MTMRRTRSPRGSGELLAAEIIEAATDLLAEKEDRDAVSIRAVAGRVGVTPPSIYLHFADKDELLDAVCAGYFEKLDDVMESAADGVDDPVDRALRQGMAYVRFAVANPAVYRASFSGIPDADQQPTRVDQVLAASAFLRFSATATELIERDLVPTQDVTTLVLELWAAAHGVASLMIAKPGLPWGDDFDLAQNLLSAVCAGKVRDTVRDTAE